MIKPIAIYLPQFHPILENDEAWGEGFTEWTNVRKAKPLFDGHYQPHIPHEDVGYYDLRDPEVMVRQAAMAKEHGIYGFAFYHYWFNGKLLLNDPLDNMLQSGSPDFPFLYIWANENWTKRWDGQDNEVIIKQEYTHEDDIAHIRFLCDNVFNDKRYIRIDDKPVFVVYRTELLPDINETARIWREEVINAGFKGIYLIRVENFVSSVNPLDIGFDASMEFTPDFRVINRTKAVINPDTNNIIYDYIENIENISLKQDVDYPWFRSVFPGWDNSARRSEGAITFINNTPELFRQFIYRAAKYTEKKFSEDSRYIFINAWNEWGEGCHIEPDTKNGYAYLKAIDDVLNHSTNEDLINYIDFLEKGLKLRVNQFEEYELLKLSYNKIMRSRGHVSMEKLLKVFRNIKRRFI